jgi:hypothetical protein
MGPGFSREKPLALPENNINNVCNYFLEENNYNNNNNNNDNNNVCNYFLECELLRNCF